MLVLGIVLFQRRRVQICVFLFGAVNWVLRLQSLAVIERRRKAVHQVAAILNLLGLVTLEASCQRSFWEGGVRSLLRLVKLVVPGVELKGISWKVGIVVVGVRILILLALGILLFKGREFPICVHQIDAVKWVLMLPSLAVILILLV